LFDDGYASKRDRVLLEFTKMESIPLKHVDAWITPDDPKRKRILFPLCKRRGILQDYKFISADLSFLKRYPHIANEQEGAWSAREMTLHESLQMCSTVARKSKNSTRPNVASKGPHPSMSKGRDGPAQGSDDLVQSVLGTVFTANKVRRSVHINSQVILAF
jgi:DNA-directed RNA polymerase-3 subunit RPC5